MQARYVVVLPLLALVSTVIAASLCFPGLAQEKYTGELSSEQRRAVELSISTNAASSGYFSSGQVPEKLRFKTEERVHIGIVMMNTAVAPLKVCAFSNPYYQNRLELLRDGKLLAYTESVSELVLQSDSGTCGFSRVSDVVDLKPNVPLRVPSVELQEWYGPLKPGQYKLTLKRTFSCCADGALNMSNKISFEVTP